MSQTSTNPPHTELPPGFYQELIRALDTEVCVCSWDPRNHEHSTWVFINPARCRTIGLDVQAAMSQHPRDSISRETLAQLPQLLEILETHGKCTFETVTVDQNNGAPLPVEVHCKVLNYEGRHYVLSETRDVSPRKALEIELRNHQEHYKETLQLIEGQKEQLRIHLEENLKFAVSPILQRIRADAPANLQPLVELLTRRIESIADEWGARRHVVLRSRNLSSRQMLICEMITDGLTSKEIASALGASPRTIDNHRRTIRQKLGLQGRRQTLESFLQNLEPASPNDRSTFGSRFQALTEPQSAATDPKLGRQPADVTFPKKTREE